MDQSSAKSADIRQQLRDAIGRFDHRLPSQAPIRDFVHHNTLHGFEHLPFPEALARAEQITGASGYLPEEQFQAFYRQGRISRDDMLQVLSNTPDLDADEPLWKGEMPTLYRRDLYIAALCYPIKRVTGCQLVWQIEEMKALTSFQEDVGEEERERLLATARGFGLEDEDEVIADLWSACLESFDLSHYFLHPEDLVDLSPEQAEGMLDELAGAGEGEEGSFMVDRLVRKEADHRLDRLLGQVGNELTLRDLLLALTGQDIMDDLRPMLLRQVASYLDQGVSAWCDGDRDRGFYAVWRHSAEEDLVWLFDELGDWHNHLESLPDDPLETVIAELRRMGVRQAHWAPYIERLAMELPGWSGMFLWRHLHPDYEGLKPGRVDMMDYLAVRLVLERLFAQRLCGELWQVEASLFTLRWYFHHHRSEFLVRHTLFNARLPEYLAGLAHGLSLHTAENKSDDEGWRRLAHMIWTWEQSPQGDRPVGHSVYRSAWRLFRLAQHLGLSGGELRAMGREGAEALIGGLDRLTPAVKGFLWLQAYERHYREQLFNALTANRGRYVTVRAAISAQLIFCMDEREEGFRRHLEEIDPTIETLGAAAHFGVPHFWRGLDDTRVTPLCPVVMVPSHEIRERPQPGQDGRGAQRARRREQRFRLGNLFYQELRRNLLSTVPLMALATPGALLTLAGKLFAPLWTGRLGERLRRRYDLEVATELVLCAEEDGREPTPEQPRPGFTDTEQLDRVEDFLQNIGLIDGFSPLVVIMAHGSGSQNNPHLAAYDCGACSGRHSGPNARIFAAIANRPEIREGLMTRGITLPEGTWFLAAEHNTCSELIEWFDLDKMPERFRDGLDALRRSLGEAILRHARERCRRFASAPRAPTPKQALDHVIARSMDFSQTRPELGHVTNAAAFIGRRSMSRGVFFDRRVFLISYDAITDPTGVVLERLLLANTPVGAGINLEYYFSTVDNDHYGCGSKVTHNITGLFGVMDGTASDLRTGLPKQMVEIHEAMRLQVVVEVAIETLSMIYDRQPALQELIGNGWIFVSTMDPESGVISVFNPAKGFLPWEGRVDPLPVVLSSYAWFAGHDAPLTPALIDGEEVRTDV